jgi:predicted lipid-binding transport protein (Tim44 family)
MDFGTGFPVDLVLFGMIAAFLILRLRSILGRRTGYERPPQAQPFQAQPNGNARGRRPAPIIEGRAEPVAPPPPPPTQRTMPEPGSALSQTLTQIQGIDRSFDPARFITGAEGAFRMIVGAYAAGDREQLRRLVAPDVLRAFEDGIAAREKAGETQVADIKAIHSAAIEEAELSGNTARITVRFVTDQTSFVRDRAGQIMSGTEAITELVDVWTFERNLAASDPAWRLMAVRAG